MAHVPLTYTEAKNLMESARDRSAGKPLQNNTRLYDRGYGFAVQLHYTDVVTILPGGRFKISTGGWDTNTTWNRIYGWSPFNWQTMHSHRYTKDGINYRERRVFARPSESDPAPRVSDVTIVRPYVVPDPGPEPVKSSEGCLAGTRTAVGKISHIMIPARELRDSDRYEPPSYKRKRHSVRSRDLVAYLEALMSDADTGYVFVDRWVVEVTNWTEDRGNYYTDKGTSQCPHCKAFDQRHYAWKQAMYGGWRTRGYEPMCDMLERFGSQEAWREEYLRQYRARRASLKAWTEWMLRNTVEFYDGIVVDSDGYVLRTHLEAHKREERKAARAARRRELELERKRRYEARCARLIKKRQARLRSNARRAYREMWPVARSFDNETVDWLLEQQTPPVPQVLIRKPYV